MATTPKKIEISQSSLLGLKAELERKRREVESGKSNLKHSNNKFNVKQYQRQEKKSQNINENLEKTDEEEDLLKKSRITLETKAKTYELLSEKGILGENDGQDFLVDFKKKREEKEEEEEEEFDEEWVDYVDCLGRTRRCHREDYETVRDRDRGLRTKLFGETNFDADNQKEGTTIHSCKIPPEDDKKDEIRRKWEEQERIISDKKDVHYQDILFNEARSHGVGYYEFSTDEGDRRRQQQELKRTREETSREQRSARDRSEKKRKQTEERLKRARKRKRERLGLPPEEEGDEVETETFTEKIAESEIPSPVELFREERPNSSKPTSVRPWDVGKEGVSPVLSQDEWIEKKRTERISEFAPPSDFWRTKKRKPEGKAPDDSCTRGVRIPPPPNYGSVQKISPNIEKSIEEGLKFLREQTERKLRETKRGESKL